MAKKPAPPPAPSGPPRTLFDKIWDAHVVERRDDGACLIYVGRHLVHEVTSPQAFEGLRMSGRKVRRPDLTIAVADHNIPTLNRAAGIDDEESRIQVETLEANVKEFGVPYYPVDDVRQGIVHIIGPEQGLTLPGMTIVCGDSHTSTHGAFGALAFGIGTSEVEHVLATQTLVQAPARNMRVLIDGDLPVGVNGKDLILKIIGTIGTAGGTGHVIEYAGKAVRNLSMEGRMTVCNMSIEGGARAGLIAPDETTFRYLAGRPYVPTGGAWEMALSARRRLPSDKDARYDREIDSGRRHRSAADLGHQPAGRRRSPASCPIPTRAGRGSPRRLVARWTTWTSPGTRMSDIRIDKVFIGSCTNGRIEDLREAAAIARDRKVADHVHAMIVPGSGLVKEQAEREGLDKVFTAAGFEWREPGCSMCLAMNADKLKPGERCASTSNRNFEGRQGRGGRTHLVSPGMAAAAAIKGTFADVRDYQ